MTEWCNRPDCSGGQIGPRGVCVTCWRSPIGGRVDPVPHPQATHRLPRVRPPIVPYRPPHSRVGAGIWHVPPRPEVWPSEDMLLTDPHVPEASRTCANPACDHRVGQSTGGRPGREVGFCTKCGTKFDFTAKLRAGMRVAKQYRVEGALAPGGQGWVYVARDVRVGQWCVLKGRRNTGDPAADAQADLELRTLATLEHEGIVKIYNLVEHPDPEEPETEHRYIVMQYVPGRSLHSVWHAHDYKLPVPDALAYVHAVMPALGYLHEHGFIYCDLKPDNMIHAGDAVTLIDLGAAWRVGDLGATLYATRGYKAPELGRTGPTIATDIYTAGRTLAFLVLGTDSWKPLDHDGPPPPDADEVLEEHDCLRRFLDRACAEEPGQRFADTEEMEEALRGVLSQVAAATDGHSRPHNSERWGQPRAQLEPFGWSSLPEPLLPARALVPSALSGVARTDPESVISAAAKEPRLSWADQAVLTRAYCQLSKFDDARKTAEGIVPSADAPNERTRTTTVVAAAGAYLLGTVAFARDDPAFAAEAVERFEEAYAAAPGEPASALALAAAREKLASGDPTTSPLYAGLLYRQVAETDPTWAGALAGQARVLAAASEFGAAAAVLRLVPETHPLRTEALTLACRILPEGEFDPDLAQAAGRSVAGTDTDTDRHDVAKARLAAELYRMALSALRAGRDLGGDVIGRCKPSADDLAMGRAEALRAQAKATANDAEKHDLLDRAAKVRPWRLWS